jgi:hypothetical protein
VLKLYECIACGEITKPGQSPELSAPPDRGWDEGGSILRLGAEATDFAAVTQQRVTKFNAAMSDVTTNPEKWSHYIAIEDFTRDNYLNKTIEVTLDLTTKGLERQKNSKFHILEGKIIDFRAPDEGTFAERWKCQCADKFAVALIEWDPVFHSHDEFKVPMAIQLNPVLAGGGDKHRAWQLFWPEFVEYLKEQEEEEQKAASEAAASMVVQ